MTPVIRLQPDCLCCEARGRVLAGDGAPDAAATATARLLSLLVRRHSLVTAIGSLCRRHRREVAARAEQLELDELVAEPGSA